MSVILTNWDKWMSNCCLTTLQLWGLVTVVPAVIVAIANQWLRDAVSIGTSELVWIARFNLILCTETRTENSLWLYLAVNYTFKMIIFEINVWKYVIKTQQFIIRRKVCTRLLRKYRQPTTSGRFICPINAVFEWVTNPRLRNALSCITKELIRRARAVRCSTTTHKDNIYSQSQVNVQLITYKLYEW